MSNRNRAPTPARTRTAGDRATPARRGGPEPGRPAAAGSPDPLRVVRARPRRRPWWHRDDRPPGRGGRPGRRDRRLGRAAQGPPPLPRVRPRAEHRLQHAVRRHPPRRHRDPPNRRGVLDGLGTPSLPDPTTAGDFCRRFDESSIMALQEAINRARLQVWSASRPRSSPRPPGSTRTPRWCPPTGSASRAWTSPTTAPGATRRCWSRWPTPASRCIWPCTARTGPPTKESSPSTTGRSSCVGAPGSPTSCCAATPTSR